MHGFTYLGLLFGIVLLGIVLAVAGTIWHTESQRDKEKELLFVGQQYLTAINAYHAVSMNGVRKYPARLEDLLDDRRFPMPVRHLRRLYRDPMTNSPEWGLIRVGDGIAGIYSLSSESTLKRTGFAECCRTFVRAERYNEWKFSVPIAEAASTVATVNDGSSDTAQKSPNDKPSSTPEKPEATGQLSESDVARLRACTQAFVTSRSRCVQSHSDWESCIQAAFQQRLACMNGG